MKHLRSLFSIIVAATAPALALAHPGHGPGDPVGEIGHIFLRADSLAIAGAVLVLGVVAYAWKRSGRQF